MAFFSTHGQVTPKWIVRTGWNLNFSEILWLYWLPASLKLIWLKVNVLSSGQHVLLYKSMGKYFISQGWITPKSIVRTISPRFFGCPRYLQVCRRSDKKWSRYPPDNIFPIIRLWELLIAMETRVLIQSAPKPYDAFHPPNWCYAIYKIWSRLANWSKRYSSLKVWMKDGRRIIAILWAFSSGELKRHIV